MRPSVKSSSPFRQRRSVDFPEPEAPVMATMAPAAMSSSMPSRTTREPNVLRKPRIRIMGKLSFESYGEPCQRKTHDEVERGTCDTRCHPVVQVHGGNGHALGELDDRDDTDERRVFQERDEVVGERGQSIAECLGKEDVAQHLEGCEAERVRRFRLTARNRQERTAMHFGFVCSVVEPEAEHGGFECAEPYERCEPEIEHVELKEHGGATKDLDVDGGKAAGDRAPEGSRDGKQEAERQRDRKSANRQRDGHERALQKQPHLSAIERAQDG